MKSVDIRRGWPGKVEEQRPAAAPSGGIQNFMIAFSPRLRTLLNRHLSPQHIFLFSFAALIGLGAMLLWLPAAASAGRLSFIDALFTSASAVCVTGLATIDIGKDLSLTGQVVTLVLFQIGGLGILTFSTVLFGLMGRGISFKGRELCQTIFLHTPRRDFFIVMKWILILTFVQEAVGVVLLFSRFAAEAPPAAALYRAVYHAVSAFNNCGYSLFSDSLMRYQGDWLVNLTVMALIVSGGIGFIVQYEILNRIRGCQTTLSLHAKIVLLSTAALLAAGALLFYLFEAPRLLRDVPVGTQFLSSLFQSVTARTAGFSTVDISRLTNATILLLMILMFIGASPGSAGGGIKTTSFTLLMLMIWSRFKGEGNLHVFRRSVPEEIQTRTIAIIFASALAVCLITSALLIAGGAPAGGPGDSRHLFVEYLFEAISAFGTVGLSMGVTAGLNEVQKLAVILLMFAGRVGPLTLAFSWYASRRSLVYAEEPVMVG